MGKPICHTFNYCMKSACYNWIINQNEHDTNSNYIDTHIKLTITLIILLIVKKDNK